MHRELVIDRTTRATRASEWTRDRRCLYLLDESVAAPYSVDRAVWPTAGDGLSVLVTVVLALPIDSSTHGDGDRDDCGERGDLLGYDVADAGMTSGLTNCGYTKPKPAPGASLNRHHLFDDVDEALAFRVATDARVPEHAPFFVYGLYRVKT